MPSTSCQIRRYTVTTTNRDALPQAWQCRACSDIFFSAKALEQHQAAKGHKGRAKVEVESDDDEDSEDSEEEEDGWECVQCRPSFFATRAALLQHQARRWKPRLWEGPLKYFREDLFN